MDYKKFSEVKPGPGLLIKVKSPHKSENFKQESCQQCNKNEKNVFKFIKFENEWAYLKCIKCDKPLVLPGRYEYISYSEEVKNGT